MKSYGNVREQWDITCTYKKASIKLGQILVFKKGEYCLPVNWFPRTKKGQLQKTNTLFRAMNKCQLWWNGFIKEQIEKP